MKKKAQDGYIATPDWYQQFTNIYGNGNQMQEVQVSGQGNPQQNYYGMNQPQLFPVDNQIQAQPRPLSQQPYQGSYDTLGTNNTDPFKKRKNLGNIQSGIADGAKAIGDIFDTLGDIKRGIIKGGASVLNALIPDTHNKRYETPIMAYNPDPYGNQQYNNIYENGGYLEAKNGIHINPEHKGDFTEWAKKHGMSVKKAASHIMANKDDYSPHVVQMANFSLNASKWDKAKDGQTITVKDKNDPRYKAYQDSLAANKKSQDIIDKMRTYNPNSHDWVRVGPHSAFAKPLMTEEEVAIANEEAYKRTGKDNYIESFNKKGRYKDWPSAQYIGYRVPGEYNFDSKGKMYPAYDYYSPPVNKVVLENQPPTPSLPKSPPIRKLPSVGIQNQIGKPQGQLLQWDNVRPSGTFPLYGNDNSLIGTYDQDIQGQTYFYPTSNYSPENQGEARGLPPNYITPSTISNIPTNIRRKAKDGQTLTVYDRNDPRYKAYQDSLALHNYGKQQAIKFEGTDPGYQLFSKDGMSSYEEWKKGMEEYGTDRSDPKIQKKIDSIQKRSGINPAGRYLIEGDIPYFQKPVQKVTLSQFDRIPAGLQPTNIDIQTPNQLAWDNVRREGTFPLYGNDNNLIGTYNTDINNQSYFFPNQNYSPNNMGESRGLPSNTIIVPEGSTEIKNVRRMKDGGELSSSKAKEILKDGTANGKKLTPKQKRYMGWVAGGRKAEDGAVVTDYGYGDVPNITPAQEAALSGFVPYTQPEQAPLQPISDFGYYSPNQDGTFAINIDRHLMDRSAPSGRIGDTYSYGTNRAFGYEGIYGNKDYQPTMFMNTGYNRYFENGGTLEQGQVLNLTKAQRKYYEDLGYEFE